MIYFQFKLKFINFARAKSSFVSIVYVIGTKFHEKKSCHGWNLEYFKSLDAQLNLRRDITKANNGKDEQGQNGKCLQFSH